MARPTSLASGDKLIRVDEWIITRLQNFNYTPQMSSEDIREMGSDDLVETVVDPYIPVDISMTANCWGTVDLWSQLMGEKATSDALYSGATADRNDFTINEDDIRNQCVDFIQQVRNNTNDDCENTVWFPNAYLNSASLSYSVDGVGTEEFTFTSDTERHLLNTYKESYVAIGTYASSTTFTVNVDPGTSNATYTGLYVSVNGTIYDNTYISGWPTGDPSTVTVTGITLSSGDRIRLVYYKTTPGDDNYTNIDSAVIGAIKGSYVKLGLKPAATTSDKNLRVQSVDIDITVNREEDKELGTNGVIGRTVLYPVEVNVSTTVNETDMTDYAAYAGKTFSSDSVITPSDLLGNDQDLIVQIYDDHNQTNVVKTITVDDMRVTGYDNSHDVGGKGQVTWTFRGDNFQLVGGGDIGRLASSGAYPSQWPTT